MSEKRFEKVYAQGVNYLYHYSGYAGGLTPLLDREGKPVISTIIK